MVKGSRLSEEHRAKLRKAWENRVVSEETKEKLRLLRTGRKHSEATKRKISASHIGISHTPEIRLQISKKLIGNIPWNKGKKLSPEYCKTISKSKIGNTNRVKIFKKSKSEYSLIHQWIKKNKEKGNTCQFCNKYFEGYKIQFANKSGLYKRELEDWLILCSKCHAKYDQSFTQEEIIYGRRS